MSLVHRLVVIGTWTVLAPSSLFHAAPASGAGPAETSTSQAAAQRRALFGDLHLHTALSLDAYTLFGAKVMPDAAYRFAKGEAIPYQGTMIRRKWPLDFMAVTDHAENMGVLNALDDPDSTLSKSASGQKLKTAKGTALIEEMMKFFWGSALETGYNPRRSLESAWAKQIEAANKHYRPGQFTTFIAYEWSAIPDGQNLHRNVLFKGNTAPLPHSSNDSPRAEDLWAYMDRNRAAGVEALAIPHNGNASNGLMYDWLDSDGKPIDQAYAEQRIRNEPLSEIAQKKGQSETHPLLSPNDEFAGFELFDHLLQGTRVTAFSKPSGSTMRDAYGRGLVIEARTGTNPYKFGIVGATDFHNGLSTSDEDSYDGNAGGTDPDQRIAVTAHLDEFGVTSIDTGSGALTGVWAEENTRESIYAALRRKETFATSGSRLQLRFFGGWDFEPAMLQSDRWVDAAYARGVSMGGDLPARPRSTSLSTSTSTSTSASTSASASASTPAPRFLAWALKDPNGANLDRLQVIKVWLVNGKHREKVFDVAYAGARAPGNDGGLPPIGNTVDVRTATYSNTIGATQLSAVWSDPEFDPATPAVYYLRVIEIPTPRWSTILAVRNKTPLPEGAPTSIQERGWSSPIWFAPGKSPANKS